MAEKERRDPRETSGMIGEDLRLGMPAKRKKAADTVPVATRISKELYDEIVQVAADNGVKPGRLIAYALMYFMRRLKADPAILKFETRRELPRG